MSDPALGANQPSTGALAAVESMSWPARQWLSVAVSVVLTPLGLACAVSGGFHQYTEAMRLGSSPLGVGLVILGAVMLLVVAATARIAGLGPVIAGVATGLFGLIALFSTHLMWDLTGLLGIRALQLGTVTYASVLMPAVGALLVGAGLSGRWTRGPAGQDSARGPIVEL